MTAEAQSSLEARSLDAYEGMGTSTDVHDWAFCWSTQFVLHASSVPDARRVYLR